MTSISRNNGSVSLASARERATEGEEGCTDGIWGFFVKVFSGLLKFLPGRDVDHLSIWEGGRGPPRAESGSCLFLISFRSFRHSAAGDRVLLSSFPLPLSLQTMATDQRKRPFPFPSYPSLAFGSQVSFYVQPCRSPITLLRVPSPVCLRRSFLGKPSYELTFSLVDE